MHLIALATAVAAMIPTALSAALSERPGCVAPPPSKEEAEFLRASVVEAIAHEESGGMRIADVPVIDTHVHVVTRGPSEADGTVPLSVVLAQYNRVVEDFAPSGIQFNLAGVDWYENATWAADQDQMAMKRALRKGGYAALNLYYLVDFDVGNPGGTGYCYLPVQSAPAPGSDAMILDGCTMALQTMPTISDCGGCCNWCDTGRITTHEVGHWLGLAHTFDGGCSEPGDGISDTPASEMISGCPAGTVDTCPGMPGTDPLHNHMSYTNENEFTPQQMLVMGYNYWSLRHGK
ncbi:Extracellular metalloprotease 1 [Madurella mycetomatis]|uniref:Extracellular metalloprotease 1 n=1 Tax=Madurella mycetomatis TaxID=100816 RepID=A0A175WHA7_9PEZI|nr:Extracellular metalloprotease 1 [Madurella mycetomatis]